MTYAEAFQRRLGIDPHAASLRHLRDCAIASGIAGAETLELEGRDGWLDLLLSHLIEPHLGSEGMTFLYDYPSTQAALSRVRPGEPPLAERFELYIRGVELANGFHELADAGEQRRRFLDDNCRREAMGLPTVPPDEHLLSALEAGMPDAAGVALGIDRLLMVLNGCRHISETLAFDAGRA